MRAVLVRADGTYRVVGIASPQPLFEEAVCDTTPPKRTDPDWSKADLAFGVMINFTRRRYRREHLLPDVAIYFEQEL